MKCRSREALVMANPTPAPGMGPKEHSWAIVPYVKSRREVQIDELVRHSFELQKTEARLFPFSAPVTVIHGTSSVGKSSIIAGMRASIPELEELGADLLGYQIALKYIKDHHPETYAFLHSVLVAKSNNMHILDAVSGGVFHFKATATALEREEADRKAREISGEVARAVRLPGEEIDHIMLDKAMSYAADKSPVIFDILNIERVFGHTLGKMPMRVALVYCPIDTLVARIQNRNRSAFESQELSEVRLGESPLVQLGEIFRPKVLDEEPVLFSITREQVERGFDALFEEWAQVTHTSYTSTEKADRLDRVLHALGFTEPSVVRLEYTPRFKGYDFVIDTSVVDSRSAAKILVRDVASEEI